MPIKFTISEIGENGIEYPIDGPVYASSKKELINLYNMLGKKIIITSETLEKQDTPLKDNFQYPTPKPIIKEVKQVSKKILPSPPKEIQLENLTQPPVKYFTANGINFKLDLTTNKLYTKQWVKVDNDSDFRIISDKTNREITSTGKHIEMLTWKILENE